jgi:histidinol phosphatase-like enzyme
MHHSSRVRAKAPLPGTVPPPRGLFLDRWGTLLEAPPRGLPEFSSVRFADHALDLLFRVGATGWKLYLIGNEDAVARGEAGDEQWARFESELLAHLRSQGVAVARCYACLEDPQRGRGAHKKGSVFRLPDTGIFFHAQQADGVSLRQSVVVGDSTLEIAAGARAGCRTVGVASGQGCRDRALDVEPDVLVESLAAALELFLASEAKV